MAEENKRRERHNRETDRLTDVQVHRQTYREGETNEKAQADRDSQEEGGGGHSDRATQTQAETDRTNEGRKECFINEGNGISTVLFFFSI